ncbi:MAG: hypothetical protein ACXQS7_03120 [Candidatus Syntropharchaeia archaeon]
MTNVWPIAAGIISIIVAIWFRSSTPVPLDEWLFTLIGLGFLWWGGVIGAFD